MKPNKKFTTCALIFAALCTGTSVASTLATRFLSIEAENKQIAFEQAQLDLIRQIFSQVSSETVSRCQTIANQTQCIFEDNSTISSIPVEISHLNLDSTQCEADRCQYHFSVDMQAWHQQLNAQLTTSIDTFNHLVTDNNASWDGFLRMEKARDELAQSKYRATILSSIAPRQSASLISDYNQSEVRINELISQTPIRILTAGDPLSQQLANALTSKFIVDQDIGLPIYVETQMRQGTSNNRIVVEKQVRLRLLDPKNLSHVVQQLEFSEQTIAHDMVTAKELARQNILARVNQHTFYELFLGRK
ncbi:hypothetical protein [Vibrio sp. WXL103]|uniref:hypothetical protein n=1 Tax=Vibrio sp. WXL103 TaxID=3450710 RepID=UPI003EC71559